MANSLTQFIKYILGLFARETPAPIAEPIISKTPSEKQGSQSPAQSDLHFDRPDGSQDIAKRDVTGQESPNLNHIKPLETAKMTDLKNNLGYRWDWLADEPAPKMLLEALNHYGVMEYPGGASNETIIGWSHEIDRPGQHWIGDMFETGGDAVPWCGLFIGMVAKRSGKPMPNNPLSALAWSDWGVQVARQIYGKDGKPSGQIDGTPMLGDVMTFKRKGGGHVGLYVGEDAMSFHVLGGNQDDTVNITRIVKTRFYSAQRFYSIGMPSNVRPVIVDARGPISENEA